ncbi:alpha/beta hydrolase family protein [Hydrogenophaga sp. RAC07]|uniref:hydrolase 1, exosortase A system-associated n=1 Tax=Hydrogenophaga sp. RAC07 TaxID=1842537 RepID=UPI00083D657A|nr:hydrolase 1, exosortase A system-associated [Hydrogenophaga sp. RAC07]AOF86742.1 alpha/beta hydrolase family protein [Hydrogenophaga sp. RAC07]
MSINEHSMWLHGEGFDMLGIVSLPPTGKPLQNTGVVIVVGGAQYRAGSHRQFVQLARYLADGGFPVLRFDLPGMGDSPGELPSFEDSAPHIAAAIDGFQQRHPGVERVVLWGLCDGASASLLYVDATHDARVAGLALLNPWVRSEVSLARARVKHYYWQRLREPGFWRKLFKGRVSWNALKELGVNVLGMSGAPPATQSFQARMAHAWRAFDSPILLLLSERDLTAQEFVEHANLGAAWAEWNHHRCLDQHTLALADHTCSALKSASQCGELSRSWLQQLP